MLSFAVRGHRRLSSFNADNRHAILQLVLACADDDIAFIESLRDLYPSGLPTTGPHIHPTGNSIEDAINGSFPPIGNDRFFRYEQGVRIPAEHNGDGGKETRTELSSVIRDAGSQM